MDSGVSPTSQPELSTDGDLVSEHGGDLVSVSGAADVAEQRHPEHRLAKLSVEAGLLAGPPREQARPQLRLQWLAERTVLRKGEGRDELPQPEP